MNGLKSVSVQGLLFSNEIGAERINQAKVAAEGGLKLERTWGEFFRSILAGNNNEFESVKAIQEFFSAKAKLEKLLPDVTQHKVNNLNKGDLNRHFELAKAAIETLKRNAPKSHKNCFSVITNAPIDGVLNGGEIEIRPMVNGNLGDSIFLCSFNPEQNEFVFESQ